MGCLPKISLSEWIELKQNNSLKCLRSHCLRKPIGEFATFAKDAMAVSEILGKTRCETFIW